MARPTSVLRKISYTTRFEKKLNFYRTSMYRMTTNGAQSVWASLQNFAPLSHRITDNGRIQKILKNFKKVATEFINIQVRKIIHKNLQEKIDGRTKVRMWHFTSFHSDFKGVNMGGPVTLLSICSFEFGKLNGPCQEISLAEILCADKNF